MKTLLNLIRHILNQTPLIHNNSKHLLITVWERQGLKLYPHQRDAILSRDLSSPEAVARTGRRVKQEMLSESKIPFIQR